MFDSDLNSGFTLGGDINISSVFTEITLLRKSANGYTEIYKAKRFGQWHILKCLTKEAEQDVHYQTLLEKEFRIAYPLNHPNIIRTLGIENVPELGTCIIQEYIDAETPRQLSKQQTIELCEALIYLHQIGVVHRDIKPENLLIRRDNQHLVLIDFGLADKADFTTLKGIAGTTGYIDPALWTNPDINPKIDIYALGVLLAKTTKYKRVAYKCTNKNIDKRYHSVLEIKHALSRSFPWIPFFILLLFFALIGSVYVIDKKYIHSNMKQITRTELLTEQIDSLNTQIRVKIDSLNIMKEELESLKNDNKVNSLKFDSLQNRYNIYHKQTSEKQEEMSNCIRDLQLQNSGFQQRFDREDSHHYIKQQCE